MEVSIRLVVTDKKNKQHFALVEGTHVPSLEGRGEFEIEVWSKGVELFDSLSEKEIARIEERLFEELLVAA